MKAFFKRNKYTPHEIADALVVDLINLYEHLSFICLNIFGKYSYLKKNKNLKNIHQHKRIFIIGNSPSINQFDLKKLKNDIVIMVNRSFNHKDYENIKPNYHIIVDPKLANGKWPIEYLDIILKKNPSVTLLLNSNWYYLEKFKKFKNMQNVYWVKNSSISLLLNNYNNNLSTKFNSSGGVVGVGLSASIYFGSKEIYFLGVELNGVINLLANKDSHFGGKDPDYENHTSFEWARDLNINSRGIRKMTRFCDLCTKNNIKLTNLTKTGLMDFIPRDNFDNFFN